MDISLFTRLRPNGSQVGKAFSETPLDFFFVSCNRAGASADVGATQHSHPGKGKYVCECCCPCPAFFDATLVPCSTSKRPDSSKSRNSRRMAVVIFVKLWGIDAEGRVFSQSARAYPGADQEAALEGIQVALRVGDFIRLQCEDRKANFLVVEVNERSGRVKIRLTQDRSSVLACWNALSRQPNCSRPGTYSRPRCFGRKEYCTHPVQVRRRACG